MMAFRCSLLGYDGPILNAALVALWFFRGSDPAKKHLKLCDFQGGGPDSVPPPSGFAHV